MNVSFAQSKRFVQPIICLWKQKFERKIATGEAKQEKAVSVEEKHTKKNASNSSSCAFTKICKCLYNALRKLCKIRCSFHADFIFHFFFLLNFTGSVSILYEVDVLTLLLPHIVANKKNAHETKMLHVYLCVTF